MQWRDGWCRAETGSRVEAIDNGTSAFEQI
jgi:hypothetical protein